MKWVTVTATLNARGSWGYRAAAGVHVVAIHVVMSGDASFTTPQEAIQAGSDALGYHALRQLTKGEGDA